MSAPTDAEAPPPKATTTRVIVKVWLVVAAVLGLLALSLLTLRRGTAARAEGEPAIARIDRAGDGSCWVGGKREHCYRLEFSVLDRAGGVFRATLDVNVADRWASRVQPGAYVWVVRDRENPKEVSLAVEAFEEPAPKPEPGAFTRGDSD
jgi:hypothetical protein